MAQLTPDIDIHFPQDSTKVLLVVVPRRNKTVAGLVGDVMSIATEILTLRRNQFSSVQTLLAAIEWERSAQDDEHLLSRGFAVSEAADLVLLNVAAHAADALSEPPVIRKTRRVALASWWKRRGQGPGQMHQRRLFA